MRRAISLVVAAMLMALLVPLSAVSANESHASGSGNGNKVTVCHNVDHHAVTIRISKKAWPAHKRHGDTLGACVPRPVKAPKGTATVFTFSAPTTAYNNGPLSTSPLFATGPIRFSWTVATDAVATTGGYWNEMTPVPPATPVTYFNKVTSGSVSPGGAVALSFVRTVPDSNSLSFSGTLASNVLTGLMSGNYFTATGTTSCTGNPTRATVCTFSAPDSAAYTSTNTSLLYATGPIRFSWNVVSDAVATTGGFWNEFYPPVSGATYVANVTGGSVSPGGAVSLSFVRPSDSTTIGFTGTLTGNVLTGQMSGHSFTATGTTSCAGAGDRDTVPGQDRDND